MMEISSQDNKYIKLAASLKNKKYRDEEKMFLVEGKRAVEEALKKPEQVGAIFLDPANEEKYHDYEDLLPKCFMLSPRLMQHICCTENPQGIAAMVKTPVWTWEDVLSKAGLLILLDRISDPGNMGSILRTCWALGAEGVVLTKGCVDPFNPKVVRSTMGAIMNLPVFIDVSEEQLDILQNQGYQFLSTSIDCGENYYMVKYNNKSVVIIGSEASGVSPELKKRCARLIKIPMNPQVDSLNVAAACAIIIAELWKQRQEETGLA